MPMPDQPNTATGRARRRGAAAAKPKPLRKDHTLVEYPRAEDKMPDGLIFGAFDIADLIGVRHNTATRWADRLLLPAADGPSVDGRPSWQRPTVLMWCMARGVLPIHLVAEYEELLRDPARAEQMTRFLDEYA